MVKSVRGELYSENPLRVRSCRASEMLKRGETWRLAVHRSAHGSALNELWENFLFRTWLRLLPVFGVLPPLVPLHPSPPPSVLPRLSSSSSLCRWLRSIFSHERLDGFWCAARRSASAAASYRTPNRTGSGSARVGLTSILQTEQLSAPFRCLQLCSPEGHVEVTRDGRKDEAGA